MKYRWPNQSRVSLSSTHQFHTKGPLLFSPQNSSVSHQEPLSSTPRTAQFHTRNPSVPHQKPLGSTSKIPQTKNVLNWGVLVWNWYIMSWKSFLYQKKVFSHHIKVRIFQTISSLISIPGFKWRGQWVFILGDWITIDHDNKRAPGSTRRFWTFSRPKRVNFSLA